MTHVDSSIPDAPSRWQAEVDAERAGWTEFAALVRSLTPEECLVPGYYTDPDWNVRDLVAHIGTWLAEAEVQLERIRAGTYAGHEVDVDALNAEMLEAVKDQPFSIVWSMANASRTLMIQDWYSLPERTEESAWWVDKSGGRHYGEHLPRLREWVDGLKGRRA